MISLIPQGSAALRCGHFFGGEDGEGAGAAGLGGLPGQPPLCLGLQTSATR
jgi:hypothetical protein